MATRHHGYPCITNGCCLQYGISGWFRKWSVLSFLHFHFAGRAGYKLVGWGGYKHCHFSRWEMILKCNCMPSEGNSKIELYIYMCKHSLQVVLWLFRDASYWSFISKTETHLWFPIVFFFPSRGMKAFYPDFHQEKRGSFSFSREPLSSSHVFPFKLQPH